METNVTQVRISENGWKAKVRLGKKYYIQAEYHEGELMYRGDKPSIKNEPVSWDTILKKVEEMVGGVEIPDIETGRYGEIKE